MWQVHVINRFITISFYAIKHFLFFPHTKNRSAANHLCIVAYGSLSLGTISWICLLITGDHGCGLNLALTAGFSDEKVQNNKTVISLYLLNMYFHVHNGGIFHLISILNHDFTQNHPLFKYKSLNTTLKTAVPSSLDGFSLTSPPVAFLKPAGSEESGWISQRKRLNRK